MLVTSRSSLIKSLERNSSMKAWPLSWITFVPMILLSFTAWAGLPIRCRKCVASKLFPFRTQFFGRFTMQILASLAKYNRNLILKGCKTEIKAANKRSIKFGRQEGTNIKNPKKDAKRSGVTVPRIIEITSIKSKQTI